MATEIERKFLVKGDKWKSLGVGVVYRQGYLPTAGKQTVRVRVIGDRGYLTIKGPRVSISRAEYEYAIPFKDAEEMLDTLCLRPLIEKKRYKIQYKDLIWEVDEFSGENEGLVLAEVELSNEQQTIELPDWIDREVRDPKYFNSNLVKYPYSQWKKKQLFLSNPVINYLLAKIGLNSTKPPSKT
jgi:CYTH domain-containing protein